MIYVTFIREVIYMTLSRSCLDLMAWYTWKMSLKDTVLISSFFFLFVQMKNLSASSVSATSNLKRLAKDGFFNFLM